MIDIQFRVKNYRCFGGLPVRLSLGKSPIALVGPNNSGKSTLLRLFYELREIFEKLSQPYDAISQSLLSEPVNFGPKGVGGPEELFCNGNDRDIEIDIPLPLPSAAPTAPRVSRLTITVIRNESRFKAALSFEGGVTFTGYNFAFKGDLLYGHSGADPTTLLADLSSAVRVCKDLKDTLYIGSFRNALDITGDRSYYDIEVGRAFLGNWKNFQNGPNVKNRTAANHLILEIKKLFGFGDLHLGLSNDDSTLLATIDGRSYRMSELGSGLSQIIIVLANAAMKNPCYILVDEPELSLHPALQEKFIAVLSSYARKGLLFSTHSYGLARASAESILIVHQEPGGLSTATPHGGLAQAPRDSAATEFRGLPRAWIRRDTASRGPD
jgi:energy-coupling factor transporter ATP-binding protein EcfA2